MKGLELSRLYYEQIGRPALEDRFPELLPQMAMGLAGEGSECFGFDDELSRDHDWGPGFCVWLDRPDYEEFGAQVQALYDALPGEWADHPARRETPEGRGRVGVLCIQDWYARYTGLPEGPRTLKEWRRVPEAFLATATNGAVFSDPLGRFTAVRRRLLEGYPEDLRLKKLAARAAVMAQAGQYNFPRCVRRGETVAAGLALAEFSRAAMSMAYLLNRRCAPFYKWMHRGLRGFPILPRLYDQMETLFQAKSGAEELIEGICLTVAAELRRQNLSNSADTFLLAHSTELMARIRDPELLESYKEDLLYAQAQGRNLLCEKYAYMMERTAPAEYQQIKDALPVPSLEALYLADMICAAHVTWQEDLANRYPNLTGRGRPIRKEMDGSGVTSFETYLRGELLTYSVETLRLYAAFVEKNQKEKINLCEQVLRNTVLRYGYPDLETAEDHQAKRT